MIARKTVFTALVVGTLLPLAAVAHTAPPGEGHYVGPGIVVTAFTLGNTVVGLADNGAVVCRDTDGNGVPDHGNGGVCIRFDDWNTSWNPATAIYVHDVDVADEDLAFQVCIDVDGDGFCGGALVNEGCGHDFIFFSHDSKTGQNHNPLFIDPQLVDSIRSVCGVAGFPGFVVITCAGLHAHADAPHASHTHHVTAGEARGVLAPNTGQGDFCGFPTALKAYTVI